MMLMHMFTYSSLGNNDFVILLHVKVDVFHSIPFKLYLASNLATLFSAVTIKKALYLPNGAELPLKFLFAYNHRLMSCHGSSIF